MKLGGEFPRGWQLAFAAVIGIVLMWYFEHGLFYGLGETIVIACFLGFTIDRWFKEDLAKNAYWVAIGEILSPAFRDEIRYVTNLRWLATECECRIKIEDVGNGVVRFTVNLSRVNENISSEPQKIWAAIGIDEWGIAGYKSSVERCGIETPTGKVIDAALVEEDSHHISWKSREITIAPGERAKTFSKSIEYRKINDIFVLAIRHPVKDPVVEIEAPDSLNVAVGTSRGGEAKTEPLYGRKTLKGTLLPSHFISFRWWPKASQ